MKTKMLKGDFSIEGIVSASVNSFIEVNEAGEEYIFETDFNDLKKHLVKNVKGILKEFIEEIEEMGVFYDNDAPTMGIHQFVLLRRRWEVLKILAIGINKKNYNKANELLGVLVNKKNLEERDKWLLENLKEVLVEYDNRRENN
jgi:hypothetical protein